MVMSFHLFPSPIFSYSLSIFQGISSRTTMIGQKLMDETADCGSFFDHIDDLLDFPVEDVEACLPPANSGLIPSIWSTQPESIPCSDSVFTGNNSKSDLSAELFVPVSILSIHQVNNVRVQ